MPVFEPNDLIKVGLLVVLEAVLSADNAIVLAVMVLPLPPESRGKALWFGIGGTLAFRVIAVLLAVLLMQNPEVILLGGLYLLYLSTRHFLRKIKGVHPTTTTTRPVRALRWLSQFWTIVIFVQLTDIAFSIDSILAAIAMSNKVWVVITGGMLGIITMRFVTGRFLRIIEKVPALVDGAYVIVLWMGTKLVIEFLHRTGRVDFEIPDKLYLSVIGVILVVSLCLRGKTLQESENAADPETDTVKDRV